MLVRQSQNTFVRFFDDESAYITNQLTRYDRTYNDIGADFLKEISRVPKDVDDAILNLAKLYGDSVSFEKLKNDFLIFIESDLLVGEEHEMLDEYLGGLIQCIVRCY